MASLGEVSCLLSTGVTLGSDGDGGRGRKREGGGCRNAMPGQYTQAVVVILCQQDIHSVMTYKMHLFTPSHLPNIFGVDSRKRPSPKEFCMTAESKMFPCNPPPPHFCYCFSFSKALIDWNTISTQ